MKIEIISKNCIKPSSPTPHHLQFFKLSDQHRRSSDFHSNLTFFYPAHNIINGVDPTTNFVIKSNRLQQSLSQTLTSYYPFAGRFQNDEIIICNDDGILFIEAQIDTPICDFLNHPDLMSNTHKQLVLTSINSIDADADAGKTMETSIISKGYMILVKFILFSCGGTVIGISMTHKLADLASMATFLRNWSASCRLDSNNILPDLHFIGQTIPDPGPNNSSAPTSSGYKFSQSCTKEYICKRLSFSASKIEQLKSKVIDVLEKSEEDDQYSKPSRVDVVVALIWKSAMHAAASKSRDQEQNQKFRPSTMLYSVNIRPRLDPPLTEACIGNLACQFLMMVEKESEMELHELVKKLGAMKHYADKMGKKFQGDDQQVVVEEIITNVEKERNDFFMKNHKKNAIFYFCTSFFRFSLLEIDFGWGKPVLVTSPSTSEKHLVNTIVLMDSKVDGGIEAELNLWEEEMSVFECNEELLQFAIVNPNII
ncbi:vinorine synthase-like [Quillaja saponaria]|uniref:Vinorine synthase-like n=1 Tax=Quillaja saponaria TaxID=32244 RepID=A0AAD7PY40_QUISA|nr:vinorine synthase-like [Quillaja saponaria]KAJ7971306.1 vinorine synthase-like [Quillaja saponaria]